MTVQIEDIMFWILIAAVVVISVWLLFGSPSLENALITIGLFIIGSEISLWRKFFSLDKKTAVGFIKVGYDLKEIKNDLIYKQDEIKNETGIIRNELANIKTLLKKK